MQSIAQHLEPYRQALKEASLYTREGKIDKIVGMTIEATGVECNIGDVCDILVDSGRRKILSEVVGFRGNIALLMPYQDLEGIGHGSTVRNRGTKLSILSLIHI